MKNKLILAGFVALLGASMAMGACPTGKAGSACTAKKTKTVVSCKRSGDVKGSAKCSKSAEKCTACKLDKGSAGCAVACKK